MFYHIERNIGGKWETVTIPDHQTTFDYYNDAVETAELFAKPIQEYRVVDNAGEVRWPKPVRTINSNFLKLVSR